MYDTKPAYASTGVWGSLLALIGALTPLALQAARVTDPGQQQAVVDTSAQVLAAIGGVVALYGRLKATTRIA
jgi:hypothetical protein